MFPIIWGIVPSDMAWFPFATGMLNLSSVLMALDSFAFGSLRETSDARLGRRSIHPRGSPVNEARAATITALARPYTETRHRLITSRTGSRVCQVSVVGHPCSSVSTWIPGSGSYSLLTPRAWQGDGYAARRIDAGCMIRH